MLHDDEAAAGRLHLGAHALCRDPSGRLLLVRQAPGAPDEGRWTLPGGGVRWGEDPGATVVRELEEETGVDGVTPAGVVAVHSHVYARTPDRPQRPVHHVALVYDVRGAGPDLRPERDGTTDACGWFAADEAAALPLTPTGALGVALAWPA